MAFLKSNVFKMETCPGILATLLYTGHVKKNKKKEFAENIHKLVMKKVKSENLHVQRYPKY
jgi:hypothetical protein